MISTKLLWNSLCLFSSYRAVYLHINSFHKVLVEDLHSLEMSEHWPTVIRYVMNAWPIVDKSPVWEDSLHNRARGSCYRNLGPLSSALRVRILIIILYCRNNDLAA